MDPLDGQGDVIPRELVKSRTDLGQGDAVMTSLPTSTDSEQTSICGVIGAAKEEDATQEVDDGWSYGNDAVDIGGEEVFIVYEFGTPRVVAQVEIAQTSDPEKYANGYTYDYIRIEYWDEFDLEYYPFQIDPVSYNHTGVEREGMTDVFTSEPPVTTLFIRIVLIKYAQVLAPTRRSHNGAVHNIGFGIA